MAVPTTRDEFKNWILNKLGRPTLEINVSDEQIDDRIDEALRFWWDNDSDGTERQYYKYTITDQDVTNHYLTLPDNIIGAVQIFDPSLFESSDILLNVRYQLIASDLLNVANQTMVPYVMTMQHISLIQEVLNGMIPIRYNRISNRLYIDASWTERMFTSGGYVVIDAYSVVDPQTYTKAFGDRMLLNYAYLLVKQQWGTNLKKFEGMELPGGLKFNGQQIYDEATADLEKLEAEIINSYSLPSMLFIG